MQELLQHQVQSVKVMLVQAREGQSKDQKGIMKPVKEVDASLQLMQKETQLKGVRKELQAEKQLVQKLKSQKAELKQ